MNRVRVPAFRYRPFAVLVSAALGWIPPAAAQSGKPARPNILFIAVDDMRPQTGAYGFEMMKSPTLDKISLEGMRFRKAYCNVPVCGASRASLLTGMRPLPDRFVLADTRADKDAPGAASLPQVFKESGYHTLSYGKIFHHADDLESESWSEPAWKPALQGADYLDPRSKDFRSAAGRGPLWEAPDVPDNAYPDGMMAERVARDLGRVAKMDRPFFMAVGFLKPHMPFYAPKKYWDLYDADQLALADNRFPPRRAPSGLGGSREYNQYHLRGLDPGSDAFHRTMRHGYYASVSYIDAQIAKVLDKLRAEGLADNTLVLIWGDHGWNLGEHDFWGKHNLMDNATRVPLVLSGPGVGKGQVLSQLVEFVDLFPTLLEYAGIPTTAKLKEQLEGTSFMPLLRDPARSWKKAVFVRFKEGSTVVTDRYAYTQYGAGSGAAANMLFDHQKDPQENENVAKQSAYASVLASVQKMHSDGWKEYRPVPASLGEEPGAASRRRHGGTGIFPNRFGTLFRSRAIGVAADGPALLEVRNMRGAIVLKTRLRQGMNALRGSGLEPGLHVYAVGSRQPGSSKAGETGKLLVLP